MYDVDLVSAKVLIFNDFLVDFFANNQKGEQIT